MDFGVMAEDDVRFLHQAIITDTINHAFSIEDADVRLYYIDQPDRVRLVKIVTDYVAKKLGGKNSPDFKNRFSSHKLTKERWGLRIEKSFQDCFAAGYKNVLLLGSRTPTITPRQMNTALKILEKSDAVFGPTPEGRYYSIGMSGSYRIMLSEFDWKSPLIFSEVAQAFSKKRLAWTELDIWYAVETPDYLEVMVRDINQYRFEGDETTARETELVMERLLSKLEQ